MGLPFVVSIQLTDWNIHQIGGKDRSLGNCKHFRRHVGDTSWPFIQQSHPQDQDMSVLLSLSLFLIRSVAWKTHIRETWLRILQGKESFSRSLGGTVIQGPALVFFHLHRFIACLSQLKRQSSKAYAVILDFDSGCCVGTPWLRLGLEAALLFYFIGSLRQAMLADPPGDL